MATDQNPTSGAGGMSAIKNVLYATGMIQTLVTMAPPGDPGTPERTKFVSMCCEVFGVTPSQAEDAING